MITSLHPFTSFPFIGIYLNRERSRALSLTFSYRDLSILNITYMKFGKIELQCYKLSSAAYIVTMGAITAAIRMPTMPASTMMIAGSIAAIRDCTAISTSSS